MQRRQPVEQLGRAGALAQRVLGRAEEGEEPDRLREQRARPLHVPTEPHFDDLPQPLGVRERDVVVDASAQERVREIPLGIARDDDDRCIRLARLHARVLQLGDLKVETLDLVEDVVREISRRLVDLVDKDHRPRRPVMLVI